MAAGAPAWYVVSDRASDPFQLVRVSIADHSNTARTLGRFLLDGLTDTDRLGALMSAHGYERVAEYVRTRRIPTKLNIKVANFGEVVSGHLIEEEEGFVRPIEKLRYTFSHEWSPHLTDIFAVLIENDEIETFAYCEVKAGTTHPDSDTAAKGYSALLKVWQEKTPEILHFTSERLWDSRRFVEYERLDRAMSRADPVSQLLRLVLVFDEAVWSDSILDDVINAIEHDVRRPRPSRATW